MNRKEFLRHSATASILLGTASIPLTAIANGSVRKLTILHTNDQHSRIDPFPMDGTKLQGLGGFARRATIIEQIRRQEKNVLLLDSGDIFQGTPYFNKYHGEVEIKLMNEMLYDASTIGNHDFDGGLENLAKRMTEAQFPFLNANYNTVNTPLQPVLKEYKIFHKGGIKIGVFGVGIELHGLVAKDMSGETQYRDPIADANRIATLLRHDEQCDVVICLSHLGYKYDSDKVSDRLLASSTTNIDLILGGHTHTFFEAPESYANKENKTVLVNQVGWAGIYLGQIDLYLNDKNKWHTTNNLPIKISTKSL